MKDKKVGVVKCGCGTKCAKMWYKNHAVHFRGMPYESSELVITKDNVDDLLGLYLVALMDVVKEENKETPWE